MNRVRILWLCIFSVWFLVLACEHEPDLTPPPDTGGPSRVRGEVIRVAPIQGLHPSPAILIRFISKPKSYPFLCRIVLYRVAMTELLPKMM